MTRAPSLNLVACEARWTIWPAPSETGISGNGIFGLYTPLMTSRSRKLSATAFIWTRTCPGPGSGRGTDVVARLSTPHCVSSMRRMTSTVRRGSVVVMLMCWPYRWVDDRLRLTRRSGFGVTGGCDDRIALGRRGLSLLISVRDDDSTDDRALGQRRQCGGR